MPPSLQKGDDDVFVCEFAWTYEMLDWDFGKCLTYSLSTMPASQSTRDELEIPMERRSWEKR
jgi:hypothetical protein